MSIELTFLEKELITELSYNIELLEDFNNSNNLEDKNKAIVELAANTGETATLCSNFTKKTP